MGIVWEWARNLGGALLLIFALAVALIVFWAAAEWARLATWQGAKRAFTYWGFWYDFLKYRRRDYAWNKTAGGREWAKRWDESDHEWLMEHRLGWSEAVKVFREEGAEAERERMAAEHRAKQ